MFQLNRFFIKLLLTVCLIFTTSIVIVDSALAVTQFKWTGRAGYSLEGEFNYSLIRVANASEEKIDQTQKLQFMTVDIYNPSQQIIDTYTNVTNGQISSDYFKFRFAPSSQQIIGEIDIGGESAGEFYLKGTIDQKLSLIKIDSLGTERIIDQNDGSITIKD